MVERVGCMVKRGDGPYGHMAIKIGHYILSHPHRGKIAIRNTQTEEAGLFKVEDIIALIDKYFAENF